MPTLEWIGKDKVVNHHLDVPYRVLERQYSYDESGKHEEDKLRFLDIDNLPENIMPTQIGYIESFVAMKNR